MRKRPFFLVKLKTHVTAGVCLALAACSPYSPFVVAPVALTPSLLTQPEGASGYNAKPGWSFPSHAVAAANPLATEAGLRMLRAGGSAVDAAIAVQMVLTLVEPQSSGIGGGAFLLHADGRSRLVQAYDGRETAPALVDEKLFLDASGKPMAFHEVAVGGRAVGTPGTVAMLALAHGQHGKLPWAQLFAPAIDLADNGFPVGARLHTLLVNERYLKDDATAAAYFYPAQGRPVGVGQTLRNPALADVLRLIARHGPVALSTGAVAEAIIAKVQRHAGNPGRLALGDLAGYQARQRPPLCFDYRALARDYLVCGMPPPASGTIAIGQILGMLGRTPAGTLALNAGQGGLPGTTSLGPSAGWLHLYTEAARLALADRAQYIGDPDFTQPPGSGWASLLAPAYLAERAKLINATGPRMTTVQPGVPGAITAVTAAYAPMPEQPEHGTSHVSIVDGFGNALAMTTTIESQFGSRLMTDGGTGKPGGFLLNNELTDFSFAPADAQGRPVANRVQPGKRPRSSMAPTLVFDKVSGELVLSGGSPGGELIIHYTAKTLYGVLNWRMSPQQAINLPNFAVANGVTLLEAQRFSPGTREALRARGGDVREAPMTSGLQAITRNESSGAPRWLGGADPRREGVVMGD